MSAQTRETLAEAIAAHVADECDGELVGAWVMVAETLPLEPDEDESTMHSEAEGSVWACRGLLEAQIDRMAQSGREGDE